MGDMRVAADNLRLIHTRALAGGRAAANAMAARYQTELATVELRQSTHPRGTPTPAAPGQPPSLVTGALRRSVTLRPATQRSTYTWVSAVYPTIVYARIHELGGWAGRNHASYLPPRPYMLPARIRLEPVLPAVAAEAFRRAVGN